MKGRFFDTAERGLNAESGHATVWSNFGFWRDAHSYPEAAEALARRLADAMHLGPSDRVLDLGFGMGEQLRLWHAAYGVRMLTGVNPSPSQNAVAQQQPCMADFRLIEGWAEAVLPLPGAGAFDKVLALDCAYHFAPRAGVFRAVAQSLARGGCLGLTDLYLPRPPGPATATALRGMCALSRIPHANLLDREGYRRQLAEAGLTLQRFEDITADVFVPFARWWRHYGRRQRLPPRDRLKFATTAAFIARAAARGVLGYALVIATPQASPEPSAG